MKGKIKGKRWIEVDGLLYRQVIETSTDNRGLNFGKAKPLPVKKLRL